jgi:hypothetical protein
MEPIRYPLQLDPPDADAEPLALAAPALAAVHKVVPVGAGVPSRAASRTGRSSELPGLAGVVWPPPLQPEAPAADADDADEGASELIGVQPTATTPSNASGEDAGQEPAVLFEPAEFVDAPLPVLDAPDPPLLFAVAGGRLGQGSLGG